MQQTERTIETDYLIVGSGTAGLAFADTLLAESDAHITIVDRHGKPGGHWNDAYSFVTLHQPSAFYGVNSLALGSGQKDSVGLNQGLMELASGAEVSAYFNRVMNHRLLPSGRVSYHPLCNYLGNGQFESLLSGEKTAVTVRRKVVDATYFSPPVPSTHQRRFKVSPGVQVVPPNALPSLGNALGKPAGSTSGGMLGDDSTTPLPRHFVVLGGGKTAMDTCVWLLQSGASPAAITWVVPRDSWLINRNTTQTNPEFFADAIGGQAKQMQAFAQASSIEDLYLRLEACGMLLRLFPNQSPSMFHLATVAPGEADVLRTLANRVVRLGRVQAVAPGRLQMDRGSVDVPPNSLFIDCTASAVEPRAVQPIFQPDKIVLQMVRLPQPAFSSALTAYVEAHYDNDKQKNALCGSVPFPHQLQDYPRSMMVNMWNQYQWGQDKVLRSWIRESRLDGFTKLMFSADPENAQQQAILASLKQWAPAAMANLPKLVATPT